MRGTSTTPRGSLRARAALVLVALIVLVSAGTRTAGRTAAAQAPGEGGLNPTAQRAEMIRLLGSIDQKLQQLVELAKQRE